MQIEQHIVVPNMASAVERLTAAAGVALGAAGSGLVAYYDPSQVHLFPVCPLFAITGFACPGCGLTRGFHALFHGDLLGALHFNALIIVWGLALGYAGVSLGMLALRGHGLRMWPTSPRFMGAFMIVLLAFGVLRNIPLYPFSLLFP